MKNFFGAEIQKRYQLAFSLIPHKDKRKLGIISFVQLMLSFLDLIGVGLIGIIGTLSIRGINTKESGQKIDYVLKIFKIDQLDFQLQVAILGALAIGILIGKSLISMFFTRKILRYLSNQGATMTADLFRKVLSRSILEINKFSRQETIFMLTTGINSVTVGMLGNLINMSTDLFLSLLMISTLMVVDPYLGIVTTSLFIIVSLVLNRFQHRKAKELGSLSSKLSIESNEKMIEVLGTFRESSVKNRLQFYSNQIRDIRIKLAESAAELSFMPNFSKYVIEIVTMATSFIICAIEFFRHDSTKAIGVLSIFLASSTRIAPAILRIQQYVISIKTSVSMAGKTLDLIEELQDVKVSKENKKDVLFHYLNFRPIIELQNISFKYPQSEKNLFNDLNVNIEPGSFVSIVGPSGSGKTTLVDILMGVIKPNHGTVKISGLDINEALDEYSGAIGYVPQDIMLINGTLLENICLGYSTEDIPEDSLLNAIEVSDLSEFVNNLPQGLNTKIQDRGTNLSGGQKQRIGIARALISSPLVLVLDEATSSLDGNSEYEIIKSISELRGKITVITIAHRLSTVRNADKVLYLENGKIIAQGTFIQVRESVPNFDTQAKLMGL